MSGLVVALWSEARPVIAHFGLREEAPGAPFRLYRGNGISLIVSRVGKTAAAAATSYLFAAGGGARDGAWINFGICGHGSRPVGDGLLASRVEDQGSGRFWYPCPVFEPPAALCPVTTLDRVEEDYRGDIAYEMEAAGFYATAVRFSMAELIQVYKVVSDGPQTDPRSLTAARIGELASAHLEPLEKLVQETGRLAEELRAAQPRVDAEPWLECWRFTVSQRRRLRLLLGRLRLFLPGAIEPSLVASARDGSEVLARLAQKLSQASTGIAGHGD